jgi:hypothetical protein
MCGARVSVAIAPSLIPSAKVRVFIDLLIERFGDDPFCDRAIFRDGE